MNNEWVIYQKSTEITRNKKYISITKNQTFGLPRAFINEYRINNGAKAVIIYNKNENKIALMFSMKDPAFGYSVRFSKNPKHGAMVVAKKFFVDNKLNASYYSGRYDNYKKVTMKSLGFDSVDGDAYIIDLRGREKTDSAFTPKTNDFKCLDL